MTLTADYVKSILNYDPVSGIFIWIKPRPKIKIWSIAGGITELGYVKIKIDGKKYLAHRLAYLYMTGEWPKDEIDHVNMIRSDNRWENLRAATRSQNFGNQKKYKSNKSGIKGVSWDKECSKWLAQIQVDKKKIKLGRFDNIEDAENAYAKAALELFKQFARSK